MASGGDASREDTRVTTYVVDWDIPYQPASRRIAFYRQLQRLRREEGLEGKLSTASVMIVSDRRLALQVYLIARSFGRANIYEAHRLQV